MWIFRRSPCVLMLAGCAIAVAPTQSKTAPPSVVLITLDTTRADRMGFLGSQQRLTPHLDALARQAVAFSRAYAHVPLTTASHATILTGTYPQFNHVSDMGDSLAPGIPFLPEILHRRGYQTAAFVGSSVLDPQAGSARGFDRGFDTYDANFHQRKPGEDRYQSVERRADAVVKRALAWLNTHPRRPTFLWVHLYDPHDPYDPPEPYKSQYASNAYAGEIAYADAAVGKLLAALRAHGLYENTIIAAMADHGEAFGEHGERNHGVFLYDETIHVPLLLKLPAERFAGMRVESRTGLVDVAPTILQVLGIAVPAEMQGVSVLKIMEGEISSRKSGKSMVSADRPVYAESEYAHIAFGWSVLRSWRAGKYLYVQAPRRELYDEAVDPQAVHNLAAGERAVADTIASQLEEFRQKTSSGAAHAPVDPVAASNLRALGYLSSGSGTANRNAEGTNIDPKDRIEVANLMHEALIDIEDEHLQAAIPKLERAVKVDPRAGVVYLELGNALFNVKQVQESLPILRKAVELMPESGSAHYRLGLALAETKDWSGAASEFEAAVAHPPDSADLHFYLGVVYERLHRVPDATREFMTAVKMGPDDFRANLFAGRLLGMQSNPAAALPFLQKATTLQPDSLDAHHFLANVYSALGMEQEASRERAEGERLRTPVKP